jgi:hypothetical protein
MVSVVSLVLLVAVLVVHTIFAAVATRFFRLRLKTRFGWILYSLTLIPVALFATTLVVSGPLGIGTDLGSPIAALGLMIGLPLALGFTLDVLYVPPPEEYDLPDTQ